MLPYFDLTHGLCILTGAQTLLYSLKKCLDKNILYPPELVVLVNPDVCQTTRHALWPTLCTRIMEVPILTLPVGINSKVPQGHTQPWDNDSPGLTKLHAFRLRVYDTIVFIEPDCLVLDDLYPLIKKGKIYTESEALVAAAPDIFPPDKFNSGVMVIRPSQEAFDNMMDQRSLLTNYDGSDTGFLNAYFSEWFTEMAPLARLPFHYNAQRALYDMTYKKGHRNYWDLAVAPDLKILHYSGNPKPWTVQEKGDYLTDLWRQWYQRSKNFVARYRKEKEKEEALRASAEIRRKQQEQQAASEERDPRVVHQTVSKRFKELRREGHGVKQAMAMARAEIGIDEEEDGKVSVGAQVASMFGIMM